MCIVYFTYQPYEYVAVCLFGTPRSIFIHIYTPVGICYGFCLTVYNADFEGGFRNTRDCLKEYMFMIDVGRIVML